MPTSTATTKSKTTVNVMVVTKTTASLRASAAGAPVHAIRPSGGHHHQHGGDGRHWHELGVAEKSRRCQQGDGVDHAGDRRPAAGADVRGGAAMAPVAGSRRKGADNIGQALAISSVFASCGR